MEFIIFNLIYKFIGVVLAFFIIWFIMTKFRRIVLKESISKKIQNRPLAIAFYEGLLILAIAQLASKVIP